MFIEVVLSSACLGLVQSIKIHFEQDLDKLQKHFISVRHRLFSIILKITLMFIEVVLSSACLGLVQSVF